MVSIVWEASGSSGTVAIPTQARAHTLTDSLSALTLNPRPYTQTGNSKPYIASLKNTLQQALSPDLRFETRMSDFPAETILITHSRLRTGCWNENTKAWKIQKRPAAQRLKV